MDSSATTPTTVQAPQGRVLFITLGCAKNEVDTDRMRSLLERAGFEETDEAADADVALINTCSFLASATSESIETTLELAQEATDAQTLKLPIIMCGCVPSRYGADLPDQLPEVAAFVRTEDEDSIVSTVCKILDKPQPKTTDVLDASALRTVEGTSAYVKISEGCDRYCAFCAIPYIRGHYHSRPEGEIVGEVKSLLEGGVREIVLIGQDTGIWGSDFDDLKKTLAWLVRQVAEVVRPYHGWVRVLYLQPEGITDELISTIRDTPEVLPYIDIPIQHCCATVLHRMGRKGSAEEFKRLFARVRREIPDMVLRTTALTGFPGETDEEAEEMLDFLQEEEFDYTSVFPYSREEGTKAYDMPNQVPEEVKQERAQRLVDLAEQMGFSATASHIGETTDVIIDGIEQTDKGPELIGHTWFQAPDSDGAVHIESGEATVGDIVKVKLTDSFAYEMVGELI